MKKIFIIFSMLILPLLAEASSYRLVTTEVAYKAYSSGKWTDWSDWEESNIKVIVDLDEDFVKIFADNTVTITVINWKESTDDGKGGKIIPASCVDNDGDKLDMRFRIAKDGSFQLYLDYESFKIVYNLEVD